MTLAALTGALAMHIFIIPNNVVPGGFTGIAAIFQYAFEFPIQYGILALNIPFLILAVIFLSKEFAVKTVFATLVTSGLLELFEKIMPQVTFTNDILLAVFFGGVLAGLSLVFAYNAKGSNGGTEIVARLIQRKNPEVDIGNVLFLFNLVVMGAGGFFTQKAGYNLWIVVYSLIYSYIGSFVFNKYSRWVDPVVKFTIFTSKGTEMAEIITETLKRGATNIEMVKGGEREERTLLSVVVQVRQTYTVKKIINQIEPKCFYYITAVENVVFRPDFAKRY